MFFILSDAKSSPPKITYQISYDFISSILTKNEHEMTTFFVFDDMATTNNRISLSHFLYLQLGISGLFLREQMLNTTLSTILTFSFTAITEAALKFSLFPSNNKFIGFYRHPLIFVVIAVTTRGMFCCLK